MNGESTVCLQLGLGLCPIIARTPSAFE